MPYRPRMASAEGWGALGRGAQTFGSTLMGMSQQRQAQASQAQMAEEEQRRYGMGRERQERLDKAQAARDRETRAYRVRQQEVQAKAGMRAEDARAATAAATEEYRDRTLGIQEAREQRLTGAAPDISPLQQTIINRDAMEIFRTADNEQDAVYQARQADNPDGVETALRRFINEDNRYFMQHPAQEEAGGGSELEAILNRAGLGGDAASTGRTQRFPPEPEPPNLGPFQPRSFEEYSGVDMQPPLEEGRFPMVASDTGEARQSITQDQKEYLMETQGLSEEEINARYRVTG